MTAERIHSLSPQSRQILAILAPATRLRIQAFASSVVPEEYVQERDQLINTLKAVANASSGRVELELHDVEQYSDLARFARDRFGIIPRLVSDTATPGSELRAVFMGVTISSGASEDVIPFLDHGQSPEYAILRAIRNVARAKRKRIGIIDTDAGLLGGMDYQAGRSRLPWDIVRELRNEYEVVALNPSKALKADSDRVDALVVALPSRLLQSELESTMTAIKAGVPAVMLLDPAPAMDMRLAPAAPMAARVNPYVTAGQVVSYKNTGDIQTALADVGIKWVPTRIAWDSYRPGSAFATLPWEVVVVGRGSGSAAPIADDSDITRGLQQLVFMYPGALSSAGNRGTTFESLLTTGTVAGTASYFDVVRPSPSGPVLNPTPSHVAGDQPLTLAARVRRRTEDIRSDVVAVADLDFISNQFFAMRETGAAPQLDNVALIINALDVLTGDESLVDLRKQRARYRTLERVEAQTRAFMERRNKEEQAAAAAAAAALDAAAAAIKARGDAIQARHDLDDQSKQIMLRNMEETENQKLEVLRRNIQQARDSRIQASRETMESGVRQIETWIRVAAILAPAIPIGAFGAVVLIARRRSERRCAPASGRLLDHD